MVEQSTVRGQAVRTWMYAIMMVTAACSYGLVSTILKFAYRHGFGAGPMTSAQYDFALVVIWPLAIFVGGGLRLQAKQWPVLVTVALCGTIASFFYNYTLSYLPASVAIVLLFQFTWMVPIIDVIVKRRGLPTSKWMGLALIVIGTVLAVGLRMDASVHLTIKGVVFGLVTALFYGVQLYVTEYFDDSGSPFVRSAYLITIAAIITSTIAVPTWMWNGDLQRGIWWWGLLAGLFSQVVPLVLMSVSIPRIGGRTAGVLGSAELPAAVLLAAALLHEPLSLEQWMGTGLILVGILVSELMIGRSRPAAPHHTG